MPTINLIFPTVFSVPFFLRNILIKFKYTNSTIILQNYAMQALLNFEPKELSTNLSLHRIFKKNYFQCTFVRKKKICFPKITEILIEKL